jgi:hypothetical protein
MTDSFIRNMALARALAVEPIARALCPDPDALAHQPFARSNDRWRAMARRAPFTDTCPRNQQRKEKSMTSLTLRRLLAIAAILTAAGCTTGNSVDTTAAASVASAGSHTLVLTDANGHRVRLNYSPGRGWTYLAGQRPAQTPRALSLADFSPVMRAQALSDADADRQALANADPLSVFIDGPTGYTFAWTGDGGWKFVGRVSGEQP